MKIAVNLAPLVATVYSNMLKSRQTAENVSMTTLFAVAWFTAWGSALAALLWFSREYEKAARGE